MKRIGAMAGVSLLLVALVVGTAGPGYAVPAKANFATQARDAGLTNAQAASLQTRVNTYLGRTGGAQVAINKIDLDGKGTLLLALPGEDHAREIGAASRPDAGQFDCQNLNFCAFSGQDFTGDLIMYYFCAPKLSMPFSGFGSYLNVQTDGTAAHFYDSNKVYMYDSLRAANEALKFNWLYIYFVKPCGAF